MDSVPSQMRYLTYISATKLENCSIENLETRINNFFIQLNDVNITFFKVSVKLFHCAFIETYNPNEYKFEGNTVKVLKKGEILQDGNLYTNETEWANGSLAPVGILSVCKQPPMDCSGVLVRLTKDEYVLSSNGLLYRNISRELYKPEHSQFIRLRVVSNFGDGDCGVDEIHTRARNFEETRPEGRSASPRTFARACVFRPPHNCHRQN